MKNEAAALEGEKSKTIVSSAKRKKGTDQLLHYQHLRDQAGVNGCCRWKEITAKFCQGNGLPKSFLGNAALMTFNF